jgi:Uma2 family endonuclease
VDFALSDRPTQSYLKLFVPTSHGGYHLVVMVASSAIHPTPPLTMADLLEQLGDIPPFRVRLRPPPGEATEADVLALHDKENRLFELVDGVLVEKAMGFRESVLALFIARILDAFVRRANLGIVSGADGMMRLFPRNVRIPDVAYVSWSRVPGRRMPSAPIPELVPDLAVEVLSKSNTVAEMRRKRREYFAAGCSLVWIVDPDARTVAVFASEDDSVVLDENAQLTGGQLLSGFSLSLKDLFSELDRQET